MGIPILKYIKHRVGAEMPIEVSVGEQELLDLPYNNLFAETKIEICSRINYFKLWKTKAIFKSFYNKKFYQVYQNQLWKECMDTHPQASHWKN